MRILIIAFTFPPTATIGAVRPHEFARHWALAGHEVTVVAADEGEQDATVKRAFEALPSNVTVQRIVTPPPKFPKSRLGCWLKSFCSYIGDHWGDHWNKSLPAMWDALIRQVNPEVILVSIPPFSIAPLICDLAKSSGIPVILDFRDAWSQWSSTPRASWIHYQLQLLAERRCLKIATRVTGVTQQLLNDLMAAHPSINKDKFCVIPNGFNAKLEPFNSKRVSAEDTPFIICYVGQFYFEPKAREAVLAPWWKRSVHRWLHFAPRREDWLYRSPWFFLTVVHHLVNQHPGRRSQLKIRFVGVPEQWLKDQVATLGLEDVVELVGRMPHDQCLKFQSECDALLLTSVKVLGGRDFCIAGKTFEYFATGRPIIGCVTAGEQRNILLESGAAVICDPDHIDASSSKLLELLDGRVNLVRNEAFLFNYSREQTSLSMLRVMRSLKVDQ
jgi:glycosyltransferase involved in cell wall biosynthesis